MSTLLATTIGLGKYAFDSPRKSSPTSPLHLTCCAISIRGPARKRSLSRTTLTCPPPLSWQSGTVTRSGSLALLSLSPGISTGFPAWQGPSDGIWYDSARCPTSCGCLTRYKHLSALRPGNSRDPLTRSGSRVPADEAEGVLWLQGYVLNQGCCPALALPYSDRPVRGFAPRNVLEASTPANRPRGPCRILHFRRATGASARPPTTSVVGRDRSAHARSRSVPRPKRSRCRSRPMPFSCGARYGPLTT